MTSVVLVDDALGSHAIQVGNGFRQSSFTVGFGGRFENVFHKGPHVGTETTVMQAALGVLADALNGRNMLWHVGKSVFGFVENPKI